MRLRSSSLSPVQVVAQRHRTASLASGSKQLPRKGDASKLQARQAQPDNFAPAFLVYLFARDYPYWPPLLRTFTTQLCIASDYRQVLDTPAGPGDCASPTALH